jgi:D-alanine transaminase
MEETKVYLNGEFMPQSEARIPVMDRGFLFGDSIYEVIPAYGGRLFRLDQHLHRLDNSLHAIRIKNPLSKAQWTQILETLIQQQPGVNQSIYLQISRGSVAQRDHAIPEGNITPTVFAMSYPIPNPDPKVQQQGISAITLEDIRWHRCDIKATTLLANVLLRQQAKDHGAMETILIRDGYATEGAASNLFIVDDDQIITPPKGEDLLPGITRDLVLELAAEAELPYAEAHITFEQLETADEIWLTSSTKEIMPVTHVNEMPVNDGKPGPMWHKMQKLFQAYKAELSGNS